MTGGHAGIGQNIASIAENSIGQCWYSIIPFWGFGGQGRELLFESDLSKVWGLSFVFLWGKLFEGQV